MLNVLVLGGTRFMGKHLVEELISQGHFVTIATRGITTDGFGDRVCRLVIDRNQADSLQLLSQSGPYDVVFDSLAYCSNDVRRLLDRVTCGKYVQISSVSVYENLHPDIREDEFCAHQHQLKWYDRSQCGYDEGKRQAECCTVKAYGAVPSVRIRFPLVTGKDDYTNRLYFYVDHVVNQKPMYVDPMDAEMAFIRSDEAGRFAACFADREFTGAVNGASEQTISVNEMIEYVKMKTGRPAVLSPDGDAGPYNGVAGYDLNLDQAKALGVSFTPLKNWIFELIDYYIELAKDNGSKE